MRQPRQWITSTDDFIAGKKLRDLFLGGFGGIGAVHGILADRYCNDLADRAGRGLGGIRRAHQVAIGGNRILAFEYLHDNRPRRHEVDKLAKEWPSTVNRVKCFGL